MTNEIKNIASKLMDMNPDPIPKFVLIKEFLGFEPESAEYQSAYEKVIQHKYVKQIIEKQNSKGFWEPFHGETEYNIRKLLSFGLDGHESLERVKGHIINLLEGKEEHDRFEKQDNIRWWPEIFMPLCLAGTLALLDKKDEHLAVHRQRWAFLTEAAYLHKKEENVVKESNHKDLFAPLKSPFDHDFYSKAFTQLFDIKTRKIIPPFNLYCLTLLAPNEGKSYLSDHADKALVDYALNYADYLYYVFNNKLDSFVPINNKGTDNRDFCHWLRALSLVAQFRGWKEYEARYVDYIMSQANSNGLWEFSKKCSFYVLSDAWRGKSKVIDSTIAVLRFLAKIKAM